MKNIDVRQYALEKRVNLWEVSEFLGYSHESSFSRIMRHELSEERKAEIKRVIDKIAGTRAV